MRSTKHIIVTGGAGFIGSHIAHFLIAQGYKVTILDDLSTGKESNIPQGADFIKMDLGEQAAYRSLKQLHCDAVFHLAGQSSGEISFLDPLRDLHSHVLSTFWLLEWCKEKAIPRFMYASSMGVYGDPKKIPVCEDVEINPKSFYGAAKASAENYIKLYQSLGINTTVFRFFNVYGPGQNFDNKMQGMASIYLSFMIDGVPVQVKGVKERFRDFIYIDDLVRAWMAAYENPVTYGKVYNLSSGKKVTVEELLAALKECIGDQDYPIQYLEGTPGDQFGITGDNQKIVTDLNWAPKFDLLSGLTKMVESAKKGVNVG